MHPRGLCTSKGLAIIFTQHRTFVIRYIPFARFCTLHSRVIANVWGPSDSIGAVVIECFNFFAYNCPSDIGCAVASARRSAIAPSLARKGGGLGARRPQDL